MGRKVEMTAAAMIIFGQWAASAAAEDIPRYNPSEYCQKVADVSGGSSMIYSSCIEMEQNAYDKRKANWSSLSTKSRSYCDEVAKVSGGSYAILDSCIDMETDASTTTPEFRF